MKLNSNGFMLAEVVVVSVVVATVLITLFTGLNNVSSAYETRNRYYDIDSLYVAIEANEILRRNNVLLDDTIASNELGEIDLEIDNFSTFYSSVVNESIYIYYTPYDKEDMLSLRSFNNNLTFSDYLDYLSGNLNFNDNYGYMIIVERRKNPGIDGKSDDCYYYALKLKY